MIDIEATDVAESRFAEVDGANRVRLKIADRRGTNEKAVAVVLRRRSVVQEMNAELLRVTLVQKILPVQIRDCHLLIAPLVKDVQPAVRIFLEAIEDRCVVLITIGIEIAEQAKAEIRVA